MEHPFRVKLVQLQDMASSPCQLALVEDRTQCKYLVVRQVVRVLLTDSYHNTTLQTHFARATRAGTDCLKAPSMGLRQELKLLGAIDKGGAGTMVSLAVCIKALSRLSLPTVLVEALRALHGNSGVILEEATLTALHQNSEGHVQPKSFHFARDLPITLPPDTVPTLKSRERLSLTSHSPTLIMQMQDLKVHSKGLIVIGRKGGPVSSDTWQFIAGQIYLFLGYLHKHFKMPSPTLELFTRADLLHAYFGSKGKRGDRGSSICKMISVARKVVLFWRSTCPSESAKLLELDVWLGQWAGQARLAWPSPRRNIADLKQQDKWQDAPELLGLLMQHKAAAECTYAVEEVLLPEQARQLHDVALLCMMFGWVPPPRSSCIMTLCPPWHRGPCLDPDCSKADCWGNRIYVRGTGDSRALKIYLPHHKSARVWGPIEYDIPAELSVLLCLYLCKAYMVLRQQHGGQHPFMFMDSQGQAFQPATFSLHYKSALQARGGAAMSPHTLRNVFVVARMQRSSPQAPIDQAGAAYCMGHDPSQWQQTYDLGALQSQGQAAIESMTAWRREVMHSHPDAARLLLPPSSHAVQAGLAAVDKLRVGAAEELVSSNVTCTSASSEGPSEGSSQYDSESSESDSDDDLMVDL